MANDGIKITAPVSMTDIATVLGDSTNMGVSENIKIWSRNKPYEAHDNHYKTQTGNDRLRNAYGFYWWNVSQEADAPFATSASALMDKALASKGEWKWKKPVTTQRMGDFDGYNHLAHLPYDTSVYNIGAANRIIGFIKCWDADPALGYDKEVELKASDMPAVGGANVIAGFEPVMLLRPVGSGSVLVVSEMSEINVGDLDDGYEANFLYDAPETAGEVTYDVVLAATDINRNYWMYFPYGVGSVTTNSVISPYLYEFTPRDIGGVVIASDDTHTTMDYLEFSLRIWNSMGIPITVQYSIKLWNDGDYDNTLETRENGITVNGNTAGFITREDLYTGEDETIDKVMITVDVNFYREDTKQWQYRRYDFLSKKLVDGNSTEEDGVTIYDILNASA